MVNTNKKCRWFRFSLLSLFLFVTLICIWLGWGVSRLKERKAMIELVGSRHGCQIVIGSVVVGSQIDGADYYVGHGDHPFGIPERIPILLRWMGATPIEQIGVPVGEFTAEERDRIRAAFPELGDSWLP
jgi:hypothetical protein